MYEDKVLRRILDLKLVIEGQGKLHDEELCNLYSHLELYVYITVIKSRRMR